MAGYCLVKEAGGWHQTFPVEGHAILRGAKVLAEAFGAVDDLKAIAGL